MFHWFMKGDHVLHYEARELSPTSFQLKTVDPTGAERVERFTTAEALHARQLALETELKQNGWTGPHRHHG